ncbi:serine/threonine-protein kinase DCLK2-like [Peromyscus leucopus]|uniref:serine/threonine-protein kinase DCLK2-like n=1 Tax=Peromyscus leucopus TaxID=10041 RepID=UPI00188585F3|nr:serine/threonine-protein kinase DCLK2-like [Peromyscus leucopus]
MICKCIPIRDGYFLLLEISAPGRSSSNVNGGPELDRCLSPEGVNGNRCSESFTLLEKYRIGKVIGDGNFAVVKECVDRSTGKEFALKIIDKAKCCGKVSMYNCYVGSRSGRYSGGDLRPLLQEIDSQ